MTAKEKALSQLLQLSESEAEILTGEILTGEISRDYAVLPDREVLDEYESLPSGWFVGALFVIGVVIALTVTACSLFCGGA